MIAWLNFEWQKFSLRVLVSTCLIFYQFQPDVDYKKVDYKKSVYIRNIVNEWMLNPVGLILQLLDKLEWNFMDNFSKWPGSLLSIWNSPRQIFQRWFNISFRLIGRCNVGQRQINMKQRCAHQHWNSGPWTTSSRRCLF